MKAIWLPGKLTEDEIVAFYVEPGRIVMRDWQGEEGFLEMPLQFSTLDPTDNSTLSSLSSDHAVA
jgi:hypothetical protein